MVADLLLSYRQFVFVIVCCLICLCWWLICCCYCWIRLIWCLWIWLLIWLRVLLVSLFVVDLFVYWFGSLLDPLFDCSLVGYCGVVCLRVVGFCGWLIGLMFAVLLLLFVLTCVVVDWSYCVV